MWNSNPTKPWNTELEVKLFICRFWVQEQMKLGWMLLIFLIFFSSPIHAEKQVIDEINLTPDVYDPTYLPLNVKEQMILSPMFTPDNALDIHVAWIGRANNTIDIQNQYITQFDDSVTWANDPSPLVRAIVDAKARGVTIRVQVNDDDPDDVATYFTGLGISVHYMGNSLTGGSSYLGQTHNKLVLIDGSVTLLSSINFGENAFTNNREAGMVIQSTTVTTYYKSIFEADFASGEIPIVQKATRSVSNQVTTNYPSHTDIPPSNFSGVYNVTAFTNPDNADQVIFDALKSAQKSIFVSMYTISRNDFTNTLVDLKKANPSIDIQVLISKRRVGASENVDTHAAATKLVDNLIPVYNSTQDDDKVDGFYHNKYWIIDGKHTFVYSGNWSPRSVTPQIPDGDTYTSGEANRDMGIAIYDAPNIADFYKSVWDEDVAVGDAWDLPIGIKQTSFTEAEVVSGNVMLSATITGLNASKASYRFGDTSFTGVNLMGDSFSIEIDTTTMDNGITSFEVQADDTQIFYDKVSVNIVNVKDWRLLITEVHSNPDVAPDSEAEFIELTNSYPFDLLISGWQIGDDKTILSFDNGYKIDAYTSILIVRDMTGFSNAFSISGDLVLDFALVNGGDYVQFIDQAGEYVDVVAYGDATAPDGSETVEIPSAGQSISRIQLHVDTDRAEDFEFATPTPDGDVPHVALDAEVSSSAPSPVSMIFLISLIIPTRRRRR